MELHGGENFKDEQFNLSQEIHDAKRFMLEGVKVVTFSIIGLISNYLKSCFISSSCAFVKAFLCIHPCFFGG